MTTVPWMWRVSKARRIASTAAWSERFFSPRPISRAAAMAASSVTRTTSSARLRSMIGLPPSPRVTVLPNSKQQGGSVPSPRRDQARHPVGEPGGATVLPHAGVKGSPGAEDLVLARPGHLVGKGQAHPADLAHLGPDEEQVVVARRGQVAAGGLHHREHQPTGLHLHVAPSVGANELASRQLEVAE